MSAKYTEISEPDIPIVLAIPVSNETISIPEVPIVIAEPVQSPRKKKCCFIFIVLSIMLGVVLTSVLVSK